MRDLAGKQRTQSWRGLLVLLYIAQADRVLDGLPTDFVYDQLRGKVLKAAAEAGVEVLDPPRRSAPTAPGHTAAATPCSASSS